MSNPITGDALVKRSAAAQDRVVGPDAIRALHRFGRVCLGEIRLDLVLLLHDQEMSVSELAESAGLEVSMVSHMLRQLCGAGLVAYRKKGRSHMYRLTQRVWVSDHDGRVSLSFRDDRGTELTVTMNA